MKHTLYTLLSITLTLPNPTHTLSWRDLLADVPQDDALRPRRHAPFETTEFAHLEDAIENTVFSDRSRYFVQHFTNATHLVQRRQPAIFNIDDSPARLWPARQWSRETVTHNTHQVLPNVGKSSHSLHRFSDNTKYLTGVLHDLNAWTPHVKVDITRGQLFEECVDFPNDNTNFHYMSGMLMPDNFVEITPYRPFVVPSDAERVGDRTDEQEMDRISAGLFIGCPGVRTHVHFDEAHNFFFQLVGRKRFVLFPPESIHDLYTLPLSHPEHRQSTIPDLEDIDVHAFPRVENLRGKGHVIVLEEGQAAYIPPYWMHYVSALSESISIQFFTLADQESHMGRSDDDGIDLKLMQIPLPFESDWTEEEFGKGMYMYLCDLFRDTNVWDGQDVTTEEDRMNHYYDTRWRTTVDATNAASTPHPAFEVSQTCDEVRQAHPKTLQDKMRDRAAQAARVIETARQEIALLVLYKYVDQVLQFGFSSDLLLAFVSGLSNAS